MISPAVAMAPPGIPEGNLLCGDFAENGQFTRARTLLPFGYESAGLDKFFSHRLASAFCQTCLALGRGNMRN